MHNITAYAKGVMGESAACDYLIACGLSPIHRRYRCACGEIDLILQKDNLLVFAEVKCRERASATQAQFSVTKQKQRRLIQTARCFLGEHPEYASCMLRFDVITVTKEGIHHIPNAFEGTEW